MLTHITHGSVILRTSLLRNVQFQLELKFYSTCSDVLIGQFVNTWL